MRRSRGITVVCAWGDNIWNRIEFIKYEVVWGKGRGLSEVGREEPSKPEGGKMISPRLSLLNKLLSIDYDLII